MTTHSISDDKNQSRAILPIQVDDGKFIFLFLSPTNDLGRD